MRGYVYVDFFLGPHPVTWNLGVPSVIGMKTAWNPQCGDPWTAYNSFRTSGPHLWNNQVVEFFNSWTSRQAGTGLSYILAPTQLSHLWEMKVFMMLRDNKARMFSSIMYLALVVLLVACKAALPGSEAGACNPCVRMRESPAICVISVCRKSPCTQAQGLASPVISVWRWHVFPFMRMC